MNHASSIQLSNELRICSGAGCCSQYSRQQAWSLHQLNKIRAPIFPARSRCNVFLCQSLLTPGGGNEFPAVKSAAVLLLRSYDALRGSFLVVKLIPAIGVLAFAAWGLVPLMCLGRTIFLHKSENSWKKSRTHHVVTSYLQPLLLWTGVILICRELDPVVLPSKVYQAVKQRCLNFVQTLSTVLAFAYCLSSLIQHAQKFFAKTDDSTDARNMGLDFAGKAIYSGVWVAAVTLFMELLGFSTQKWVTAGGLGTVLLTLAGREIFTNFLSSVMIHATQPFILNEWIQTKIEGYEVSGTVEHVGWWSPTIIRGDDREAVHIPNHKFTVNVVRNLSQKTHWRIKTHLAISHLDVSKINSIIADMRKVLAKNPQIEQQRLHRRVFLDNIDPENQALLILVSCFVKTPHIEVYLGVKEAVLVDLLRVISHHRARLATPIRTVQKIYGEADLDNVPSDSIFTRSRAATHRPFLLIEPSYKINGEDKVKASTRPANVNEEKDKQAEAAMTESKQDSKAEATQDLNSKRTKDVATTSSPDAQTSSDGIFGSSVQSKSEKQMSNKIMGDKLKEPAGKNSEGIQEEPTPPTSSVTKPDGNENGDVPSATAQSKQGAERPVASPSKSVSPLEENIVLGVALEGSKRTLPIEEEMAPSPPPVDPKELAASRNTGGSPLAGKDEKDDQMPTTPSNARSD